MKFLNPIFCILLIFMGSKASSQTINWGNEVFGEITDSEGNEVDNTYFFELGAFFNGIDPTIDPISQWLDNWRVFDSTTYDTNEDRMHGTVDLRDEGTRDNPHGHPTSSTASFAGLEAYIWIRKGDQPIAGTEWLLMRADDWVFPAIDECCGRGLYEFSTFVDDIAVTDVPLWGRQNSVSGPGEFTSGGGTSTLQTYTFPIPEPSSTVFLLLSAVGVMCRRNRSSC